MPEVSSFPSSITAGDTLVVRRSFGDYPASAGWSLVYTLINGTSKITLPTAAASGDEYVLTVPAATSAGYAAGFYTWVATVTLSGSRFTVESGTVSVLANLSAATTYDARTPARQALDDVNSALRTYGNKAWQQSYSIGGRAQTFRSVEEFLMFRDRLMAEVAREESAERLAAGLQPRNKLFVRFGAGR